MLRKITKNLKIVQSLTGRNSNCAPSEQSQEKERVQCMEKTGNTYTILVATARREKPTRNIKAYTGEYY